LSYFSAAEFKGRKILTRPKDKETVRGVDYRFPMPLNKRSLKKSKRETFRPLVRQDNETLLICQDISQKCIIFNLRQTNSEALNAIFLAACFLRTNIFSQ
ncbi:MAG: hypothetical protein ACI8VT_001397, partial [Saprospiraceae bacterium]